jgi:hypothetical protein
MRMFRLVRYFKLVSAISVRQVLLKADEQYETENAICLQDDMACRTRVCIVRVCQAHHVVNVYNSTACYL